MGWEMVFGEGLVCARGAALTMATPQSIARPCPSLPGMSPVAAAFLGGFFLGCGDQGVTITSVDSLQVPGHHEHPDKHCPDHADFWWAHSGKKSWCLGSKHSSFTEMS